MDKQKRQESISGPNDPATAGMFADANLSAGSDFRQQALGATVGGRAVPKDLKEAQRQRDISYGIEPFYQIIFDLHKELGSFIKNNLRTQRPCGFNASYNEPVDIQPLVASVLNANNLIEIKFDGMQFGGVEVLQCRQIMVQVQSELRGFLLDMSSINHPQGLGKSELAGVLNGTIHLDSLLGLHITNLEILRSKIGR